ncbi:hypothetical protein FQA39_LY09491 [Lamprigera yunnana]|nr:hypothetical protein FQA39_LY09491 [Lamprigera yunnana]
MEKDGEIDLEDKEVTVNSNQCDNFAVIKNLTDTEESSVNCQFSQEEDNILINNSINYYIGLRRYAGPKKPWTEKEKPTTIELFHSYIEEKKLPSPVEIVSSITETPLNQMSPQPLVMVMWVFFFGLKVTLVVIDSCVEVDVIGSIDVDGMDDAETSIAVSGLVLETSGVEVSAIITYDNADVVAISGVDVLIGGYETSTKPSLTLVRLLRFTASSKSLTFLRKH